MIELNKSLFERYIFDSYTHEGYSSSVKMYNEIKVHSEGETPDVLLTERRPGESVYIYEYRRKIYQPKTKSYIGKVLNTLQKIWRSPDWSIQYDAKAFPSTIPQGETLQDYCETNFPEYGSLTKWYFSKILKQQIIDPNAVILIYNDLEKITDATRYPEPDIDVFNSPCVLDYKDGKFAALVERGGSTYESGGKMKKGDTYYFVTTDKIVKIIQSNDDKTKWQMVEINHNLGYLPCFKLGGIVKSKELHESRINGMIPSLNTAVTLYTDKQAEIVQHVHSEKWLYQTQQCKDCGGVGRIPVNNSAPVQCNSCKGNGTVNTSPYSNLVLNPASMAIGEKALPTPPAGYIQKEGVAQMVKVMSDEIKGEIYDALSAINMEFLMETPLNESGESKKVDRDELNNFVYGVAEDAVGVLDKVYLLISFFRYGQQFADMQIIKGMCPKIAVPNQFDLLSSQYYLQNYQAAKNAKISPRVLAQMELEYVSKTFYTNPEIYEEMTVIYNLDPLPSVSEEDKMVMLSNRGITQKDYIISSNIDALVKKAILENDNFLSLTFEQQKKVIEGYAMEIQKENSAGEITIGASEAA